MMKNVRTNSYKSVEMEQMMKNVCTNSYKSVELEIEQMMKNVRTNSHKSVEIEQMMKMYVQIHISKEKSLGTRDHFR